MCFVFQHPPRHVRAHLNGLGHSTWHWLAGPSLLRFDRRDSGLGFSLFRPWALQTLRPEWCRRQNGGISLKDFTQPYFMRVTFRQRDPNAILPQLEFCTGWQCHLRFRCFVSIPHIQSMQLSWRILSYFVIGTFAFELWCSSSLLFLLPWFCCNFGLVFSSWPNVIRLSLIFPRLVTFAWLLHMTWMLLWNRFQGTLLRQPRLLCHLQKTLRPFHIHTSQPARNSNPGNTVKEHSTLPLSKSLSTARKLLNLWSKNLMTRDTWRSKPLRHSSMAS